ncbi:cell division control protein 2 homolog 3-like [Oratosquilla oratoria]|uniref:cell division control protein 2 homolog 3-like n=1 Tax=Oratosquilla oratoria TaxID=337810 RepID=UPI003F76E6A0
MISGPRAPVVIGELLFSMIRSVEEVFGGEGGQVEDVSGQFSSSHLKEYFEIGHRLGSGFFGSVHRAVRRSTGEAVAIKCQLKDVSSKAADTEMNALITIGRHPNVISLKEVITEAEDEYIYFVLEMMDLNLEKAVKRMGGQGLFFSEGELKSVWRQCLNGLYHIHRMGIIHCDLAARNILLDRTGAVKITDFGLALPRENKCFSVKDDLFDLSVVFIFSVAQEDVDDLYVLNGKLSSTGVELVEQLYNGDNTLRKAIKSRYFCVKPLP